MQRLTIWLSIVVHGFLVVLTRNAFAQQQESVDLITFSIPPDWKKAVNGDVVGFTNINQVAGTWAQLEFFKSIGSSGDARADFVHEWKQVLSNRFTGIALPASTVSNKDGWIAHTGTSVFDWQGQRAWATLYTFTGHGRLVSLLALTNSRQFDSAIESLLKSISFITPATIGTQPQLSTQQGNATVQVQLSKSETRFNDGWVSAIEADKVVVTKDDVQVYLYHPVAHTDASRQAGRDFFWDVYLTRQFRITAKQYRDHGEVMSSFQAPYMEGSAFDNKTGKQVFLAMFVQSEKGSMFPVVAVAPSENIFRKMFPKAESQFDSDLYAMRYYNRFAVSLNDIVGQWKGGDLASINYYNIYSGALAGMSTVAMSERFEFMPDGRYTSKHQGATSTMGNMSTYSQTYSGNSTVNSWTILLTNRYKNEATTFNAWFEAVPQGFVLHLQDSQYSALRFDLVRE
jgi:hypothetical protein